MPERNREKHLPTYSSIISPEDYRRLMTKEHLYIAASDQAIRQMVEAEMASHPVPLEVVELGAGPARATEVVSSIPYINLTAVDHDAEFITYGTDFLKRRGLNADMILGDIETYRHSRPVDVFYSQGVHHHIQKGKSTQIARPVVNSQSEVGRNDPCPCGAINPQTGKPYKYKKCGLINAPYHKAL